MNRLGAAFSLLLLASAMVLYLSACGGSNTASSAASSSAAKTAYWTNITIQAFDNKVTVSWDNGAGTSFGSYMPTYNIYCSTNPTDIVQVKNRIASQYAGTSFAHTNVTNGLRYYYVVTRISSSGEGPASRIVSATPVASRPAAPFGVKATSLDSAAQLDFLVPTPPNTSIVSYKLYRSMTRNNFTVSNLVDANIPYSSALSYNDTNLSNGTRYYYAITTVINGNESEFSPISSVQPQAKTAASNSSPTQLAAFASPAKMSVEPGNGSCTIRWNDVAPLVISDPDPAASTAPYYTLYWSGSPDVINNVGGQVGDASKYVVKDANGVYAYKLAGLNNGTIYYFQVTASVKDTGGNPIPGRFTSGPVVAATPAQKIPAIPSGVSATQGSQQVLLSWNKDTSGIANVTYNIYVTTTEVSTPAEVIANGIKMNNSDSTKAFYTHSGLQPGITYYYVITAAGEGESAPSSIISVML